MPRRPLPALLALTLIAVVPIPVALAAGIYEAAKPAETDKTAKPGETDELFKPLSPAASIKPVKKKAAVGKKKAYDYERSKYKSREMSENSSYSYRFNEKGEPISNTVKKKAASKKKKRSEPPEEEIKEKIGACGSEENCAAKNAEADAL